MHAWQERFYDLPGKGGLVPRRIQLEEFQVDQRRKLSEAVAAWQGKYPHIDVRVDVVPQSPAWTLVAATAGAELIVVGNRGRGRVRSQLLGSVSHALLPHAQCPVAVIRTHG